MKRFLVTLLLVLSIFAISNAQPGALKIAKLKYAGGGDWYANPTSLPNLADFCNKNLGTRINTRDYYVEVVSPEIFQYPFIHMTGHGNVVLSLEAAQNLRKYLEAGGFLHIDDNYGMDVFVRREMKKVFPELDWIELPFSHPVYNQAFKFPNGLPKIHEHDKKAPQGFGLIYKGQLVCFYSYESDLGDGWEDPQVHNDPEEVRLKALRMGANLIQYAFNNQ